MSQFDMTSVHDMKFVHYMMLLHDNWSVRDVMIITIQVYQRDVIYANNDISYF